MNVPIYVKGSKGKLRKHLNLGKYLFLTPDIRQKC